MVQQKFYYSICSEIMVAGGGLKNLKHKPQSSGRLPHALGIDKEE